MKSNKRAIAELEFKRVYRTGHRFTGWQDKLQYLREKNPKLFSTATHRQVQYWDLMARQALDRMGLHVSDPVAKTDYVTDGGAPIELVRVALDVVLQEHEKRSNNRALSLHAVTNHPDADQHDMRLASEFEIALKIQERALATYRQARLSGI